MKQCLANAQPRWTRRKQERPQELLDAALELFVEKGFAATRVEEVAARAVVALVAVELGLQPPGRLVEAREPELGERFVDPLRRSSISSSEAAASWRKASPGGLACSCDCAASSSR